MEAHLHEWLNLLVRWIHFIVGVAWIGASFYFNWLENNLDRKPPQDPGIAGNLWAVHGGGFYHLKKFSTGPDQLPSTLHWFKWEAYTTWLSGFGLLVIVYYFNGRAYLLDPSVSDISLAAAIGAGIASLAVSWFVYDRLCRSALKDRPLILGTLVFLWFAFLAWCLGELLSGRAAYIHVGAAIGTIMVANVFFVIIPAQKEMVAAVSERRPLDPAFGASGLLRSRHNNYLTLPVLFVMISSHFPSTYGYGANWLILVGISVCGIVARHYFNIRHLRPDTIWLLPVAFLGLLVLVWLTRPQMPNAEPGAIVTDQLLMQIVQTRCATCHAVSPTQPGFSGPPNGLVLENLDQVKNNMEKVYQTTVVSKVMPLGNMTAITAEERDRINRWVQAQ